MLNKVIILLGPTGVGKSDIAVELAKDLNGEIISADSIQIYKNLNIGSGKITNSEMQNIKHYMLDILEPYQEYSVEEYVKETKRLINLILLKSKVPIIVGGTGLYLKALVNNYDFHNTPKNQDLRNNYEKIVENKGLDFLYNILKEKNPTRAAEINKNDKKRIIRALEICENNNITMKNMEIKNNYIFKIFAINMNREKLYNRINKRVDKMFEDGLENEVKNLFNSGLTENNQSMKGIGYKEFFPYFNNEITLNDVKDKIKQHSRNYAKRQLTWLRGMENIIWIDAENKINAKENIKGYLKNE